MDLEVERGLVEQAARDYVEGWYDADPVRMERALHDGLVKRSFDAEGSGALGPPRHKAYMVGLTEGDGGRDAGSTAEQLIEVDVLDLHQSTASIVVRSREYHEHLHLVRTSNGWQIVNTLWEPSGGSL